MKLVALISGGKDSCFNMMQCVSAGHEIVALAHMKPREKDELDSFMYQCVGHDSIQLYSEAMGLPLYQDFIQGGNLCQGVDYVPTDGDEVEDLYRLLKAVKERENVEGVASGAILSDYQRLRVENVCSRLGLTSYAYLWRQDQKELLAKMISCRVRAVVVKVAALGLKPDKHLGKEISKLYAHLLQMESKFGLNVCGEGGEYETFTLDCPLFRKRIVVDEQEVIVTDANDIASVGYVKFKRTHLEDKPGMQMSPKERMNDCGDWGPTTYLLDLDVDFRKIENSSVEEEEELDSAHLRSEEPFSAPEPTVSVFASGFFSVSDVCASSVGDPAEETRRCLGEVVGLLARRGFKSTDLIAVQLSVRDMGQFASINGAYKEFFDRNPPSRVCVEAPLPPDIGFVISCTGFDKASVGASMVKHMHVQSVSHWAPANIGPYSQAVMARDFIYVAGQIGLVPGTMQLIGGGIQEECLLALRSAERVLEAIYPGTTLGHAVACVCYVTQARFSEIARRAWRDRGGREAALIVHYVVVPALPRGAKVEWQVVARHHLEQSTKWNHLDTMRVDSVLLEAATSSVKYDDGITAGFVTAKCVVEENPQALTTETLEKLLDYLMNLGGCSNGAQQFQIYYSQAGVSRQLIQEAWSRSAAKKNSTLSLIAVLRHEDKNCILGVIVHFHL